MKPAAIALIFSSGLATGIGITMLLWCMEDPQKPKSPGISLLLVAALWLSTALLFGGCGFNPTEGEYGPVRVVPEQDSCLVRVEHWDPDGSLARTNWEMQMCDVEGHDVEVFGRRWW